MQEVQMETNNSLDAYEEFQVGVGQKQKIPITGGAFLLLVVHTILYACTSLQEWVHFFQATKFITFFQVNLLDSHAKIRIYPDFHLGHGKHLWLMLTRKLESRIITVYFNYHFELNVSLQLSMLALWGFH